MAPLYQAPEGRCYSIYNFDVRSRRGKWVEGFVIHDLSTRKDPRYIGKRCRNALADVVRSCYRVPRMPKPRKASAAEVLTMAAMAMSRLARHTPERKLLEILTWVYPNQLNELTNTNLASCADRDEKVIRRRKQRLARLLVRDSDLTFLPLLKALKLHKSIDLPKVKQALSHAKQAQQNEAWKERGPIKSGWNRTARSLEEADKYEIPAVLRGSPGRRRPRTR